MVRHVFIAKSLGEGIAAGGLKFKVVKGYTKNHIGTQVSSSQDFDNMRFSSVDEMMAAPIGLPAPPSLAVPCALTLRSSPPKNNSSPRGDFRGWGRGDFGAARNISINRVVAYHFFILLVLGNGLYQSSWFVTSPVLSVILQSTGMCIPDIVCIYGNVFPVCESLS